VVPKRSRNVARSPQTGRKQAPNAGFVAARLARQLQLSPLSTMIIHILEGFMGTVVGKETQAQTDVAAPVQLERRRRSERIAAQGVQFGGGKSALPMSLKYVLPLCGLVALAFVALG
jgi:hypothetical protein